MVHPRLTGRRGQAGVGSHGRAVNDRVDGCRHRGIGNRGGRRWRHAIGRAHDRGLTITDDQGAKGIRSVSNADRGRPVCRRRLAGSGCRHPWLGGPGAAVGPGRRSGRGGGRAGAIGTRRQPVQGGQTKQRKAGEASQLAPIALRPSNSRAAWCADWWAHPDAVSRLGTAWMAWEAAWAEGGTAPSRWWAVDWAERWLAPSNKSGTFSGCSSGGHRDVSPPCPITPVPERHKQNVQP